MSGSIQFKAILFKGQLYNEHSLREKESKYANICITGSQGEERKEHKIYPNGEWLKLIPTFPFKK